MRNQRREALTTDEPESPGPKSELNPTQFSPKSRYQGGSNQNWLNSNYKALSVDQGERGLTLLTPEHSEANSFLLMRVLALGLLATQPEKLLMMQSKGLAKGKMLPNNSLESMNLSSIKILI